VGVNDPGLGGAEDLEKLVAQGGVGGIRGEGTGVVELDHRAVTSEPSRFDLLLGAPLGQFLGLHAGKCALARTPLAIGAGDAAEPLVGFSEAFDNSMKCHELEIVVVRPDAKMGDALEAFGPGNLIGHEEPTGEGCFLRGGFRRHGILEGIQIGAEPVTMAQRSSCRKVVVIL
jgi:hypothetical protein